MPTAIARGEDLGCDAIQVFVKNNNRWVGRPLEDPEVDAFRAARDASSIRRVIAHAGYLINLAAQDAATLARSIEALTDELDRCDRLGLDGLVLHPGAHVGAGEQAGLELAARSLDRVLADRSKGTPVLLEITAGQGTVLGRTLEQLATIRDATAAPDRIGFCIDTCHAFAAGHPIHETDGYARFFGEADRLLGLDRLGCIHLNDSARPFASRRDRHANLGAGEIGLALFERLLADPALAAVPMLLETPRGDDGEGIRRDLESLRRAQSRRPRPRST